MAFWQAERGVNGAGVLIAGANLGSELAQVQPTVAAWPVAVGAGAFVGGVAVLYLVRHKKLLRSLRVQPQETAGLLKLALLLPLDEARLWIADLERQLGDLEPPRRADWCRGIRVLFFKLLCAAWAAWVAGKLKVIYRLLSWVAAVWALQRVRQASAQLRSSLPDWPEHADQLAQLHLQLRVLRFWGHRLGRFVDVRLYPELVTNAMWLAKNCSDLLVLQAREDWPSPVDRGPTARELAHMLEINHTMLVVVERLEEVVGSRVA